MIDTSVWSVHKTVHDERAGVGGWTSAGPVLAGFVLAGLLLVLAAGGSLWTVPPLAVGAAAALVDVRTYRIPNRLVLLAAGSSVAVALLDATGPTSSIMGCLAAVSGLAGPLLVLRVVAPGGIGSGDVKLAIALGPLLTAGGVWAGLLALGIAAGAASIVGLARRRSAVAFGPALVFGVLVAHLATPSVVVSGWSAGWS